MGRISKEGEKRRIEALEERIEYEIERWATIDAQIICRFIFEPRVNQNNNSRWIVIWDRYKKTYVKSEKNKREYKTFTNSANAIEWLKAKYKGEKEME